MAKYCSIADAKHALQVEEDNVQYDAELSGCIVTGCRVVDGLLAKEGFVVPLTAPGLVVDAAANFAAWDFCKLRDSGRAEAFYGSGERLLQVYVESVNEVYVGSV